MLKQKDIMECLPLLASVLGNQYGVTVEIGGSEAYTDGKTIHLPALPLDFEPELIIMIRGFTDHESAHIRETDFETLRKANLTPFQHNLFNILEDWRIEERLSARYPGCRENFRHLIQKLFGTQKAGDTNPAFSILNTILLTVRSWSVNAIIPRRESVAKTMERHYPGLRKALDGILDRVRDSCKDTEECIRYALELEQATLAWSLEQKSITEPEKEDSGAAQDESVASSNASLDSLEKAVGALSSDELPRGFGESLAERIELDSPKDRQKQLRVAVTGQKRFAELPPGQVSRIERQTAGLGFRLQGLMQAQKWLPVMPGVRGRFSSSLCHRMSVGNPRCLREERFPGIAGYGGSHSLGQQRFHDGLRPHVRECRVLCRGKGSSGHIGRKSGHYGVSRRKQGETRGNAPVLRHGEKLTARFPEIAYGMTPMAESLWWVMQQMCLLRENRKIILIITDGEPDSIPAAQEAFKQAQKKGFECYGLGIMCSSIATLLPHTSRVIETLPQLAPALFGLLEGVLRRNA